MTDAVPDSAALVRTTAGSSAARLIFRGREMRAVIGVAGARADKQEGDGATPLAAMMLRSVLFRADRMPPPRSAVPRAPVSPDDGWCDDPNDVAYNRPVRLPFFARHERLWREDGLYDLIGVLGWNDAPVRPRFGSAIFLHVASPDFSPTLGCVAVARLDLVGLLGDGMLSIIVV